VAGCCEYGDEPSGSGAMLLVTPNKTMPTDCREEVFNSVRKIAVYSDNHMKPINTFCEKCRVADFCRRRYI
jgi:thymidine kinase